MKPLRFAVVGTPIAHSKSPAMHAAAYRALGLPHVYERLDTSESELAARVEALRAGTFEGLNVTVPHKGRVLSLVDEIDPSAVSVSAANTLVRVSGHKVRAHNTDVPALASELERLRRSRSPASPSFEGTTALVLGSGGAARAAVAAVASLGVARIVVRSRSDAGGPALVLAASAPRKPAPVVTAERLAPDARSEADTRIVVQATSCGMPGGPLGETVSEAVAWESLPPDAVALDVVYGAETPFLARARARRIACDDGLGMLAAQGALAFSLWLRLPPPVDTMRAALSSPTGFHE